MLIVMGTRASTRRAGYLAWFCPVCRDVRPFDAVLVSRVKHLYGMPVGKGTPQYVRMACPECRVTLSAPPEAAARATHETGLEIDDLCRRTNPELFAELPERYELEERLLTDRLSRAERVQVITDVMEALEFSYSGTLKSGVEHHTSLAIVVVFLCFVVGAAMGGSMGAPGLFLWPCVAGAVLFGALAFYRAATDRRRVVRGPIAALLARSLGPLHPASDELWEAIAALQVQRSRLAHDLRAEDIEAALALREAARGSAAGSMPGQG